MDFLSNSQFPKKTNRQHNPLSKNVVALSSLYKKKKNNSVIFDSETSTRSSAGNDCPVSYQNLYEKHPSSIRLTTFFETAFLDIYESFENYSKKLK